MRMLKKEIYKSTHNGFFVVALLAGFVIQIISVISLEAEIIEGNELLAEYVATLDSVRNYAVPTLHIYDDVYFNWISHEAATTAAYYAQFLIPLIAVLPYGWSFCHELRGYHYQMICRSGKVKYFTSKYLASFISGALSMVFILLSNFVVCSFLWTLDTPITYSMYSSVYRGLLGSKLFYTHPFAFVLLWTLIAALFGGALSGLVMFFSQIINNAVFVMIVPFAIPILYDNIMYILTRSNEYSMMNNYFCGSATYNEAVLFGQIIALIAVGYLGGLLLYRRRDALT